MPLIQIQVIIVVEAPLRRGSGAAPSRDLSLGFRSAGVNLGSELRDQLCPAVEHRQDRVLLLGRQAHGHACDAEIAVAPQYAQILGSTPQSHRQRSRVAAMFLGHAAPFGHELLGAARPSAGGEWQHPVAIADGTARGETKGAAEENRRMRLLYWLGPGNHPRKAAEFAV